MDIVPVENEAYKAYEDVLLRRDACRKEAEGAKVRYIREFGSLINESFQKEIDCIAKKKAISYYQAAANRGEKVDLKDLTAYLHETMEEYNEKLKGMLSDYETCRKAKVLPEEVVMQVKSLYKKIAKLIHPDMNPALAGDETITDLWEQVVDAYQRNDLEALEELEVLVNEALKKNGQEAAPVEIPDLEERIGKVEQEIKEIISTDPYLYKELLSDSKAVAEKKEALQQEIDNYASYGEELDEVLEGYMGEGMAML